MDSNIISLACLGGVALLSLVDLWATLPAHGAATRPRPSLDAQCPYCHQALEDGTERVRCKGCGTKHHAGCWAEHGGCSVFGCGALECRAAGRRAAAEPPTPPEGFEVVEEVAGTPVTAAPAQAPGDPAG